MELTLSCKWMFPFYLHVNVDVQVFCCSSAGVQFDLLGVFWHRWDCNPKINIYFLLELHMLRPIVPKWGKTPLSTHTIYKLSSGHESCTIMSVTFVHLAKNCSIQILYLWKKNSRFYRLNILRSLSHVMHCVCRTYCRTNLLLSIR